MNPPEPERKGRSCQGSRDSLTRIEDVEIEDADFAHGRDMERRVRRRVVALVSDEELVRVGVLIGDLRLPLLGGEERLVVEAQTGLRKSDRLSTLAGGRTREREERHAGEDDDPSRGASETVVHGHDSPPLRHVATKRQVASSGNPGEFPAFRGHTNLTL